MKVEITGPPECQKCHGRAEVAYRDGYWCGACCPHSAEDVEIYRLEGKAERLLKALKYIRDLCQDESVAHNQEELVDVILSIAGKVLQREE